MMEKSNDSRARERLRLRGLTINQFQTLGNNLDSPKSRDTLVGMMTEYTNRQLLAHKYCHVNINHKLYPYF